MIKVFIVDDSATVRKVVGDLLSSSSDIEVIGAAHDPLFAMKRMEQAWPDVIVLDIEMPRMDGLTYLKKIMSERPTPVVMCSTLTQKGSSISLEALRLGAVEAVGKPKGNLKQSMNGSADILIGAVKAAARANMRLVQENLDNAAQDGNFRGQHGADSALPTVEASVNPMLSKRIAAIGASTGGAHALEVVLKQLPRSTPGIVVVQHMPEKFTLAFAERLNAICKMEVKEARNNDRVKVGRVLIAPGGYHMVVQRKGAHFVTLIKAGPLINRHRPSVDVLFRSVAKEAGKDAIGIIMTGMGDDGASGLKQMHDTGAFTLAQNEATCVVYGMPQVAVKKGAVDEEVPLSSIAGKILN